MDTNTDTVKALIEAVESNDKDRILSFFDEESVFHNIPMAPAVGLGAIWAVFAQVHDTTTEVEWVVHHIAETGDGYVLTERTDRYRFAEGWAEFKVMGIFEVADGKVRRWRDYFDLQQSGEQVTKAMGLGG